VVPEPGSLGLLGTGLLGLPRYPAQDQPRLNHFFCLNRPPHRGGFSFGSLFKARSDRSLNQTLANSPQEILGVDMRFIHDLWIVTRFHRHFLQYQFRASFGL